MFQDVYTSSVVQQLVTAIIYSKISHKMRKLFRKYSSCSDNLTYLLSLTGQAVLQV